MKANDSVSKMPHRARWILLAIAVFGLLTATQSLSAVSLSELLEKGIYTEETKGDLDAAMQLYKQIVSEAQAGQKLAAEAQYRLGVCYYKKKNYAEAVAAFEMLVNNYPDQKELVTRAREYLAGTMALLPAPWADGEEMQLDIKFPSGVKLGTAVYSIHSGETNGRKTWNISSQVFAGVRQVSRVEVNADNFRPLHSRWKHTLLGDADAVFSADSAEVKLVGKEGTKKTELQGLVYDNEEVVQLVRRLPLTTNYSQILRVFTSLGGASIIHIKFEVVGIEKVTVPAGTFECFKIELNVGQTFYYSTDAHRYLVKFEAGGIVAELARVTQRKAGEPVRHSEPGFSLTAPAEWVFCRLEKDSSSQKHLWILDPEGSAMVLVRVQSLDSLKPEAKQSPRKWAEALIASRPELQPSNIRPDSWQERSVAGHPGVSFIGDYTEQQVSKMTYGIFTFGDAHAVGFLLSVPAKDFETSRPAFEAIVDSLKEK